MGLIISSETSAKLLDEARRAYPNECCGLLLGQGERVTDIVPAANVSAAPQTHFEIDPATLITAHRNARTHPDQAILGYYHSHPKGTAMPSKTDAVMAAADGRYWVIVAGGEIGVFRAVKDGDIWRRFDVGGCEFC